MARLALSETLKELDFILVQLDGADSHPVYDGFGELLKFRSGAEASAHAARLSEELGRKIQPRRVNNDKWREREASKLKDGTYRALPWVDSKWWKELSEVHKDHFPHVSLQKQALVSFTESEEKGSADIQTVIKPGKYFERFFHDKINDYMVRDLCTIFAAKFEKNEVLFADTADEMEEVYTTGPSSCMSKPKDQYPTKGVHPVRMYAAGDLSVAYIQREGRIVARTIAWPARKIYSPHIYGDKGRMEPMLRKLGYNAQVPVGARLTKFKVPDREKKSMHSFVVPHVDGAGAVKVETDHLIITDDDSTSPRVLQFGGGTGITESCGLQCDKCEEGDYRSRDMLQVFVSDNERSNKMWCKGCADKHAVRCLSSGNKVATEAVIELAEPKGFIWSRYKHDVVECCATHVKVLRSYAVEAGRDKWWALSYAKKHKSGRKCGECGRTRHGEYPCHNCGAR